MQRKINTKDSKFARSIKNRIGKVQKEKTMVFVIESILLVPFRFCQKYHIIGTILSNKNIVNDRLIGSIRQKILMIRLAKGK
jgi:hypothetical protein